MKTRRDLIILWNVLNSIKVEKADPKFTYAVSKNKKKLEPEIKILQEMDIPNEDFKKYEENRINLCKEYAEKNGMINLFTDGFIKAKKGITSIEEIIRVTKE